MAEVANVPARPRLQKYLDAGEAAAIVENIDTRALILADPPDVDLSPDPKDNPILAAAIAGKAVRFLVSADSIEKVLPASETVLDVPEEEPEEVAAPEDAETPTDDSPPSVLTDTAGPEALVQLPAGSDGPSEGSSPKKEESPAS